MRVNKKGHRVSGNIFTGRWVDDTMRGRRNDVVTDSAEHVTRVYDHLTWSRLNGKPLIIVSEKLKT